MQIDLLNTPLLGHWEVRPGVMQCEQQFGIRLIYVEHPSDELPQHRLAAVQQQVQAAWDDIPQALAFAEQLCDPNIRQLWQRYQQKQLLSPPLAVYSIHFEIDNPHPSYCISEDPDFDWNKTLTVEDEFGQDYRLELTELQPQKDFWLSVRRLGSGQFQNDI
ncbi:hypothetical protein I9018_11435 [Pseudomonas sp. MPFS]|uniref:hypothetical protein n=1 Tax=Pseudomonas sp. MPFS TaxID=2795724 RepID=UPI001F133DBD|nr:hypothetical protein [Pseudomonas sp. MPFS]UMZ14254.1 hypothetical protein I9018_11435 [Pseudomonas sp. MPFS]